jgi:predicted acylesterase/phospholipase RssA
MDNGKMSIALAFSGGGYRAASFSLGVLSYLNNVKTGNESLLQSVSVLSTVSGGTITGAKYAVGIKNGKSMAEIYDELYSFMSGVDLIKHALDRLSSNEGWTETRVKSLINAVADVYDKHLFSHAKFGPLLSDQNPTHLKHISFNATEFANALQFRFQRSEPGRNEGVRGIIGNTNFRVPMAVAENIRMADIMASSSCFPGGFEPINFPNDFILPDTPEVKQLKAETDKYPVGLMDGGIVDNQGLEPVLLADLRMKRNQAAQLPATEHALDLIVAVDVASPYMEEYVASAQGKMNFWRKLTPAAIFTINTILLLASVALLIYAVRENQIGLIILATAVGTLNLLVFIIARIIKGLPKKFSVPQVFMDPLGKLLKLKLFVYENLIMNRTKSLLKLSNEVFLKHVRRLNYRMVFNDETWKNRRVMCAIYELRDGEKAISSKLKSGTLPPELKPSEAIEKAARRASGMGTTLWFTQDELATTQETKENMLDTVIACGQFTMCWNLLEYIVNLKKDNANTTAAHTALLACEDAIRADWEEFKANPFWMIKPRASEK